MLHALIALTIATAPAAAADPHTIVITAQGFSPNSITITREDAITFRNDDVRAHRVIFPTLGRESALVRPGRTDALSIDQVGSFPFRLAAREEWGGVVVEPAPPRVTLRAPAAATYGEPFTVRGQATTRGQPLIVYIRARPAGSRGRFLDIANTYTRPDGSWQASVELAAPADLRSAWSTAVSPPDRVLIRPRVTLARRGNTLAIFARAGVPLGGVPFRLEARGAGPWRVVARGALDEGGRAVLDAGLASGLRQARATVAAPGRPGYAAGTSRPVRLAG